MAPKNQKHRKVVQFKETDNISDGVKQLEERQPEPSAQADTGQATSAAETQNTEPGTITSTETSKKRYGGARGPAAMYKVVVKKAQGKKINVRYDELGVPVGRTRHTLQSYIGMTARTMIPIDIESWPQVNPELKSKLWLEIKNTFKVAPESETMVLRSAGSKWRQFKSKLTADYVKPFLGDKKKLRKPPLKYAFVGRDKWKKFVSQRTSDEWLLNSQSQSDRVQQRKYPHRTSRKGYTGLKEEEIKKGTLEPGEVLDRAILWKKARVPKVGQVDEELAKIYERIDSLLEKKRKGEFQPSGDQDVLTTALETPEHSGRVRGVGSFVTPAMFFDLPKQKRTRITKAELLARDKQRDAELEKTKQEFMAKIASLEALISNNPNISSPIFSDKASCEPYKEVNHKVVKEKPSSAKVLNIDEEDDCVAILPTPPDIKGPRPCELSVGSIENKVAFGLVYEDPKMNVNIHGLPFEPGCIRVAVDGSLQDDVLLPVPAPGMERVSQAVGSQVAWPKNLITFTSVAKPRSSVLSVKKAEKQVLQKMQTMYRNVEISKNVPSRFKLLYKHATANMQVTGSSIPIPCDVEVFGFERVIYILHENVITLLNFDRIGQSVICAYMCYLHTLICKNEDLEQFAFIDPALTYSTDKDFEPYVVKRLKEGNPDRMFFMPHNENEHWILVILWDGDIYILNPLPHTKHFIALEKALSSAIKSFRAETGRGTNAVKVKHLVGSPKQPGGHECGYVVMRYMKDIIEDKKMSFLSKWATKTRASYKTEDLDQARQEALEYIEDKV